MNDKKYKVIVVIWSVILLIIQGLALINVINLNTEQYGGITRIMSGFMAVVLLILIIVYMILSLKKIIAGPIIGIIVGAIYILPLNAINILVGICFIVTCVSMIKDIGNS